MHDLTRQRRGGLGCARQLLPVTEGLLRGTKADANWRLLITFFLGGGICFLEGRFLSKQQLRMLYKMLPSGLQTELGSVWREVTVLVPFVCVLYGVSSR